MTESETTKHQAVEASATSRSDADNDHVETPMTAVWLSLAAILLAGLYGLYLGSSANSKSKAEPAHSRLRTSEAPAFAAYVQAPELGATIGRQSPGTAPSSNETRA